MTPTSEQELPVVGLTIRDPAEISAELTARLVAAELRKLIAA